MNKKDDRFKDLFTEMLGNVGKKFILYFIAFLIACLVIGIILQMTLNYINAGGISNRDVNFFDLSVLTNPNTYVMGLVVTGLLSVFLFLFDSKKIGGNSLLKGKKEAVEDSNLENSRFLTDSEKDDLFPPKSFSKLSKETKDGIPVFAVYDEKRKDTYININAPSHGIIIGATGSGKTTTFINPVIQILGHAAAGSSMICTDPKGELFQLHSKMLTEHGYNCMVLDLRDPYSSFRWNPLGDIFDQYQDFLHYGDGVYVQTEDVSTSGLKLREEPEAYGERWYEFKGEAYSNPKVLFQHIKMERQKIYDALYEDLNDLISVICPIESKDDPVWEKGARSIIMATCLAMLEDSGDERLGMTKEKFCFYNISKAIMNSENEFRALKDFFEGRDQLSKAVGLSRQVLSAADQTLSSYMSIAFDKMSMFNDEGLCALTSATDIDPTDFAFHPTALFLKIPDEKDTRHALAAVFILCIYKALIKVASGREDLSLPRNVYFLLDEFGNMPKIDKFDKMITVGRSRKIWFHMVVQSFAQLNNVYGETVADIVKGNCGIKMFIGSNDVGTCKEFSELCGNMTVTQTSVSGSTSGKDEGVNYSNSVTTRPLIYPSELMMLNNKYSTGNSIIVTFGNYPLKTKFTPSYKNPMYEFGQMDMTDVRNNIFIGEDIYYDVDERNYIILANQEEGAGAA